jgi:hypothetical protein
MLNLDIIPKYYMLIQRYPFARFGLHGNVNYIDILIIWLWKFGGGRGEVGMPRNRKPATPAPPNINFLPNGCAFAPRLHPLAPTHPSFLLQLLSAPHPESIHPSDSQAIRDATTHYNVIVCASRPTPYDIARTHCIIGRKEKERTDDKYRAERNCARQLSFIQS